MKSLSAKPLVATLVRLSLSLAISSTMVPNAAGEAPTKSGPQIVIVSPELEDICSGPVDLEVRFEPNSAPVDLSTLRVRVLKLVNFDITNKVRPHATKTGIRAQSLKIPKGTHTIEISLADIHKTKATRKFTITIK